MPLLVNQALRPSGTYQARAGPNFLNRRSTEPGCVCVCVGGGGQMWIQSGGRAGCRGRSESGIGGLLGKGVGEAQGHIPGNFI
jgi:hypothetical protein